MAERSSGYSVVVRVTALAVFIYAVLIPAVTFAQNPAAAPPQVAGRGRGPIPVDPRVQMREYVFAETNERLPYAVFVSSRVNRDVKAPLVIALHGLGGTPTSLLRGNALDLAEAGGYIVVGPMGYNPRGWYGVPATGRGGARGRAGAPGAAGTTSAPTGPPQVQNPPPGNPGAGRQGPPPGTLTDANDPPNLRELSEKDVMYVLSLVRQEFNVDDRRIYLMGHSMGGAGTFHLAMKYPDKWAATASIAPAAFGMLPMSLAAIPAMPMMVVHGDMDTVVPLAVGRAWADAMKTLQMTHRYIEVPGGDHGNVITIGMPEIFTFFATHAKPATP